MEKEEYATMHQLETDYWWYKALHELVESYVKKFFKGEQLRILDAGCGTGRMIEILNNYGQVDGIDYSEEAIKFCRKRGLKNIEITDLNIWPPKTSLYDVIICLDVIYHSGIYNDFQVLKKFHTALKKNGILILNLPAFDVLRRSHDEQVWGKRRYERKSMVQNMEEIGFAIKKASYRLPHLYLIILTGKIIEKFFLPTSNKSDLRSLPPWLNQLLLYLNRFENKLIQLSFDMPFGSSLFLVVTK